VAVKVLVPSLSTAPSGMALTTSEARLLAGLSPFAPVSLLTATPRLSAIANPSTPVCLFRSKTHATFLQQVATIVNIGLRMVWNCRCFSVSCLMG
jgi:hypothetical protein